MKKTNRYRIEATAAAIRIPMTVSLRRLARRISYSSINNTIQTSGRNQNQNGMRWLRNSDEKLSH